jgi:hypothetical protein
LVQGESRRWREGDALSGGRRPCGGVVRPDDGAARGWGIMYIVNYASTIYYEWNNIIAAHVDGPWLQKGSRYVIENARHSRSAGEQ